MGHVVLEVNSSPIAHFIPSSPDHLALRVEVVGTVLTRPTCIAGEGRGRRGRGTGSDSHLGLVPSFVKGETAEGEAEMEVPPRRGGMLPDQTKVGGHPIPSLGAWCLLQSLVKPSNQRSIRTERAALFVVSIHHKKPVHPPPSFTPSVDVRQLGKIECHPPMGGPRGKIIHERPGSVGTVCCRVQCTIKTIPFFNPPPVPHGKFSDMQVVTVLHGEGGTKNSHVPGPEVPEGGVRPNSGPFWGNEMFIGEA